MAPEYARGEHCDARVDLYAVGCVMYEALTQRQPFVAANYNALLFALQEEEPTAVRELRPDVSPELAAVIARAMSKNREQRFQTAQEMRVALEPWVSRTREDSIAPALESAPTEAVRAKLR
jgi:serine/threonine-protein kinase